MNYEPSREDRGPGGLGPQARELLQAAQAMARLDDARAILGLLARTIVRTLGCHRSAAVLLAEDTNQVTVEAHPASPSIQCPYEGDGLNTSIQRLARWLEEEQHPLTVSGPPYPEAVDQWLSLDADLRSFFIAPLRSNGCLIGFFTAEYVREAPLTPACLPFLEGLADHAAAALERTRLKALAASQADALRRLEQRFRTLTERTVDVIFIVGLDGRFEYVSPRVEVVLGFRPEELVGQHFNSVVSSGSQTLTQARFEAGMRGERLPPIVEYDLLRKDGSTVHMEVTTATLTGPEGVSGWLGIAHDISEGAQLVDQKEKERRRAQRLLNAERRQRARSETLLQVVTTAASSLSLKKILIKVCQAVMDLSVGERCSIFLHDMEAGRLEPIMSLGIDDPELWAKFRGAKGVRLDEMWGFRKALQTQSPYIEPHVPGSDVVTPFWAETFQLKSLAIYPLVIRDQVVGMMTVDSFSRFVRFPRQEVDTIAAIARQVAIIIENARLFERVQQEADTDFLTGLPNHRRLKDLFAATLEQAQRGGRPFSIVMVDIDSFKLLNDTHGHHVGDEVLKHVAALMRGSLRPQDMVARYGGDEFLVILPETAKERGESISRRLARAIERSQVRVPELDVPIPVRISWGLATYPVEGANWHRLISAADAALMKARFRSQPLDSTVLPTTRDLSERDRQTLLLTERLLSIIDAQDQYTGCHSKEMATLSLLFAEALGLPGLERYAFWLAALLHDIGKIAVPQHILRKRGPLTAEEWQVMRQHVTISENIAQGLFSLEELSAAVASHHEQFDGGGYPRRLKGQEIPRLGRMLAIVDAYTAMTHGRPYHKALSEAEAVEELRRHAGSQFDPDLVEAFLGAIGSGARDATSRSAFVGSLPR